MNYILFCLLVWVGGAMGVTAGVPCLCEENREMRYYFDPEELTSLKNEYGFKESDILKDEDNVQYINSKFSYWDDKNQKDIYPSKMCQIHENTKMKDTSYANDGAKDFEGYYDYEVYYWNENLAPGHMYAACDES